MEVKREHPDALLLFRMGDFYELFYKDAEIAAKSLGLTLTSRDKNSDNPIPMSGFPYHALDGYLQKLVRAGYRAAICEQVEDPKQAKGLVRREVTRVVTPGTLTDESLLNPRRNNFLACVREQKNEAGLAWLELSTGQFTVIQLRTEDLHDELSRIQPSEVLVSDETSEETLTRSWCELRSVPLATCPTWDFGIVRAREVVTNHFKTKTLDGFGLDEDQLYVCAAGALLKYVSETQLSALDHIEKIDLDTPADRMSIDESSRRSLELTTTMRENSKGGSLFDVINRCATAMGARLLCQWLDGPSTDLDEIRERHEAVEEFVGQQSLLEDLIGQLDQAYDLQRLTSRVATRRSSPRDLSSLTKTLALLPKIKALLTGRTGKRLKALEEAIDLCAELRSRIERALIDAPPIVTTEGGYIAEGFNKELDELRALSRGGKEWISEYQAKESKRTGIPNLKIGFNKVFGYYLEVTAAHRDKVPEDYHRKQTLKNQERYITPELKEYEEKVLSAEDSAIRLELKLFDELRELAAGQCLRLKATAEILAELDVLCAFAKLAVSEGYCRPEMTLEPVLDIREGRHPVLTSILDRGEFVPNDIQLDPERGFVQIITGPNMAGKSTYIRQAALLTIMAQVGSFIPASEARIGIADRVFARVGASDELGRGHSTFMVEMTETARILNTATHRSLVILDEIGRGTSTYDGISLAWAVTEHVHDTIRCRTLFATHYHELTTLTQTLPHACNWNVAVQEHEEEIIFLHRIVPGAADKSYGIHVARLAGLPAGVIGRASEILSSLEDEHLDTHGKPKVPARKQTRHQQRSLFTFAEHPLLDQIRGVDLNSLTPLDAMHLLNQWQKVVKSD